VVSLITIDWHWVACMAYYLCRYLIVYMYFSLHTIWTSAPAQRVFIRSNVIRSAAVWSNACKMQLKILTVHSHILQYSWLFTFSKCSDITASLHLLTLYVVDTCPLHVHYITCYVKTFDAAWNVRLGLENSCLHHCFKTLYYLHGCQANVLWPLARSCIGFCDQ